MNVIDKRQSWPLVLMFYTMFFIPTAHSVEPVTPNALPQTRALLNYIASLPDKPDKRVISGHFVGGENIDRVDIEITVNRLAELTGKHVGMVESQFFQSQRSTFSKNYRAHADILIDYWRKGGLIYSNFNMPNPLTGGSNKKKPYPDLKDVYTPGNPVNERYVKSLDQVARVLQYFQDNGVVVLCELFNELTGGWHWWGGRKPADFINLYRYSVDYLVNTKKLRNLIHVWEVSAIRLSEQLIEEYYPGDDYVDIVGVSWYSNVYEPDPKRFTLAEYNRIIRLGKPFAFTELGPGVTPGTWDNRININMIQKYFPRCTFFIRWGSPHPKGQKWTILYQNHATELMNDPWIVNREDIRYPGR